MRKRIADILQSVYERDHVLISTGGGLAGIGDEDAATIGHNFEAVIADLETRMREAAADLDFEEAARLRDEIKRLRATELAVVDDPTAKAIAISRRRAPQVHKPGSTRWDRALPREAAAPPAEGASAKARASRRSTRWAPARQGIQALSSRPALDHRPPRHARRLAPRGRR